jgi:hypothetical protein
MLVVEVTSERGAGVGTGMGVGGLVLGRIVGVVAEETAGVGSAGLAAWVRQDPTR